MGCMNRGRERGGIGERVHERERGRGGREKAKAGREVLTCIMQ